jgi:beta-carotene 15,15''-monooxygenase, Brp/Blh family
MNKWLLMQSNLLIVVGLLVALFAHGMGLQAQAAWLFIALGAIVLLGVPHGSLDVLFALRAYQLDSLMAWVVFLTAYLLVAMGIILLWMLLPVWFFIGFLIFSALHFSDDLNTPNAMLTKLSYGAAVICLPSIVHGAALVGLYAVFVDASVAQRIVTVSQWLCYPILFLMGLMLFNRQIAIREKLDAYAVLAIMTLLPPVLAFAVYFCLMHSARHLIRSHAFFGQLNARLFIMALVLPTLAVIIMACGVWFFTNTRTVESDLIRLVFIGLAALTFPHAWVLKQSNFTAQFRKNPIISP